MKFLLLIALFLPFTVFAQDAHELTVGERTVQYEITIDDGGNTLYYQGDTMVAVTSEGVWILYENDQVVYEAHDTNEDGTADAFLTLDSKGDVTAMTGDGAKSFERPEVDVFSVGRDTDSITLAEEDLVGDLSSITIPGGTSYTWYLVLAAFLAAGGYLLYRKHHSQT